MVPCDIGGPGGWAGNPSTYNVPHSTVCPLGPGSLACVGCSKGLASMGLSRCQEGPPPRGSALRGLWLETAFSSFLGSCHWMVFQSQEARLEGEMPQAQSRGLRSGWWSLAGNGPAHTAQDSAGVSKGGGIQEAAFPGLVYSDVLGQCGSGWPAV